VLRHLVVQNPAALRAAQQRWNSHVRYRHQGDSTTFPQWLRYFARLEHSTWDIAKVTGLTHQRVSQVYAESFEEALGVSLAERRHLRADYQRELRLREFSRQATGYAPLDEVIELVRAAGHEVATVPVCDSRGEAVRHRRNRIVVNGGLCSVNFAFSIRHRSGRYPLGSASFTLAAARETLSALLYARVDGLPRRLYIFSSDFIVERLREGRRCGREGPRVIDTKLAVAPPLIYNNDSRAHRNDVFWEHLDAWHCLPGTASPA